MKISPQEQNGRRGLTEPDKESSKFAVGASSSTKNANLDKSPLKSSQGARSMTKISGRET
jgi:hypothetical protein